MSCFELASLIISGFVAIGTLSLACFAFKQIKSSKKQYEIRQLNDILEWAGSVIGWKYSIAEEEEPTLYASQLYRNYALKLSRDEGSLSYILRRGKTMSNVALALKKKQLFNKINSLHKEKMSMTLQELKSVINAITPVHGTIDIGFKLPNLSKLEELQKGQNELAEEIRSEVTEIISTY